MRVHDQRFDDGRGRYPDRITAGAPVGLRDLVKDAANAEGISLAEFVRQAIERRLARRAVEQRPC